MFKPTLLIDFDGTITKERGFNSAPDERAVAALNILKEKYRLVIYSCRANWDVCSREESELLKKYLMEHEIPYDEIHTRKPAFFALIDDRCINPTEMPWDSIIERLLNNELVD